MSKYDITEMSVIGWMCIPSDARRTATGHFRVLRDSLHTDPHLHILAAGQRDMTHWLEIIAAIPRVTVGAAYRHNATYEQLYPALVDELIDWHTADDSPASIVFDGNGTETLRASRRQLPHGRSRVAEQPGLIVPPERDFLQAADLIAFSAFHSMVKRESHRFMHDWYPRLLPKAEGPFPL
ncbi:hypothetical protein [Streptomyces sp. I05A-00742]|uniref:hypothetical protein n=1 Tax=Streptomyces sp. I05A-00742 TaxID=2732853 RepID=UPI0014886330|nr:hypothetical protein [Streptomyces sp. I05A-00742]